MAVLSIMAWALATLGVLLILSVVGIFIGIPLVLLASFLSAIDSETAH